MIAYITIICLMQIISSVCGSTSRPYIFENTSDSYIIFQQKTNLSDSSKLLSDYFNNNATLTALNHETLVGEISVFSIKSLVINSFINESTIAPETFVRIFCQFMAIQAVSGSNWLL